MHREQCHSRPDGQNHDKQGPNKRFHVGKEVDRGGLRDVRALFQISR
jgi:hypothetical protein